MIEWTPYDKYSREIESHVGCLVTDGREVRFASHACHSEYGYVWFATNYDLLDLPVTHYAKINLPLEVESK